MSDSSSVGSADGSGEEPAGHRRCLVLVGLPGAGATTVGAIVAGSLGVPLLDTDDVIALRTGRAASDLLLLAGEVEFRAAELDAVIAALASGPAVVALGSGALATPGVPEQLDGHDVVWLRVSVPNAISRAGLNVPRPAALGNIRATFTSMAAAREPAYATAASLAVVTDYRDPADIAEEVAAWWQDSTRRAGSTRVAGPDGSTRVETGKDT